MLFQAFWAEIFLALSLVTMVVHGQQQQQHQLQQQQLQQYQQQPYPSYKKIEQIQPNEDAFQQPYQELQPNDFQPQQHLQPQLEPVNENSIQQLLQQPLQDEDNQYQLQQLPTDNQYPQQLQQQQTYNQYQQLQLPTDDQYQQQQQQHANNLYQQQQPQHTNDQNQPQQQQQNRDDQQQQLTELYENRLPTLQLTEDEIQPKSQNRQHVLDEPNRSQQQIKQKNPSLKVIMMSAVKSVSLMRSSIYQYQKSKDCKSFIGIINQATALKKSLCELDPENPICAVATKLQMHFISLLRLCMKPALMPQSPLKFRSSIGK